MIYTISDFHLSFGVDKPMDIFGGRWENHAEKLKENFENSVTDEDTVIIPGDISWGMTLNEAEEDFRFINDLPGQKIIMKGNHDYYWQSMKKLKEFTAEKGFDKLRFLHNNAYLVENKVICGSRGWATEVSPSPEDLKIILREAIRFELSIGEGEKLRDKCLEERGFKPEIVVFSHYPVLSFGEECSEIAKVLVKHDISRVYYGHLHGAKSSSLIKHIGGIELNLVSGDFVDFMPVKV